MVVMMVVMMAENLVVQKADWKAAKSVVYLVERMVDSMAAQMVGN
jgi:hypothetical protein